MDSAQRSGNYFVHTFPNGLTFLAERMPGMASAALSIHVPAGGASDPVGARGAATVLSDLVLRGAGQRDSRALSEHLDALGLQRSSGVGVHHTRFACAAVAPQVLDGLDAYADILRRPALPGDGFAAARDLALQSLAGLDDDPRQKLSVLLRRWHLPDPLGRNPMGETADLDGLDLAAARDVYLRGYRPSGAIVAVAGDVDAERWRDAVERALGDWRGDAPPPPSLAPPPGRVHHETQPSEQTHIGIAWPSVEETHEDYYAVRLAIEALGGGMSSRLFTEVREKRGLCYSVHAGYADVHGCAAIFGYAGTSNERAQATLDCFLDEARRLAAGLDAAELERARIGLKASTVMSGESTSARAAAIAHDYFRRGRLRTLDEILAGLDAVTLDRVNDCLRRSPPGPFTIVTLGPNPLRVA